MSKLAELSVHAFIQENGIKTESGVPLDFKDHMYMFDIYRDMSPLQCGMKAAQVTWTTMAIIKSFWIAKNLGFDIIYTLPTQGDVNDFAGGKVNRIIAQNPILQQWTKDKDSVEQKQVGSNLIYYRGTWTEKAAIMVSSDMNINDEIDASKQDVVEQYFTRLQHSKHKFHWPFSHPSSEGTGIHKYWLISDQKHWFVRCGGCEKEQFLSWPESIDADRKCFQCKECGTEITDDNRRKGRWVAKYKRDDERPYSGYWVSLLICPWVSAKEILDYHKTKGEEYFYNKVLGLPFVGGGNKLTKQALMDNLTTDILQPSEKERVVMGVDTGLKLDYVLGSEKGLFFHGDAKDYDELDALMTRWPKMIAVVDAGGDLIGSRQFKERWQGRVFLCVTGGDRKASDDPVWNDDEKIVVADRNKMIQLVVDEFTRGLIPIQGTENDWYDYWLDWNNLTRIKVTDPVTQQFKGYKWVRNGRDHKALATVYFRVGLSRFRNEVGGIIRAEPTSFPTGPEISPEGTVGLNSKQFVYAENQEEN
jgi:hypothetical protein